MSVASQIALDRLHDDLTAQIKGMRCAVCETDPRVAYLQGTYKIRCECPIGMTTLEKPDFVEERRTEIIRPVKPIENPKENLW